MMGGDLYKGSKSDLITILKNFTNIEPLVVQQDADCLFIDGAMFVHANPPSATDTF